MSREIPILFSAPMVRAILEGRKTQTRRIVKPQPAFGERFVFEKHPFAPSAMRGTPAEGMRLGPERSVWLAEDAWQNIVGVLGDCRYGQPGDLLWVRETWQAWQRVSVEYDEWGPITPDVRLVPWAEWVEQHGEPGAIEYRATSESVGPWTPSIHMPKWAARIWLEVTGVRVERLQDLSPADAIAEGIVEHSGVDVPGYGLTDCPEKYLANDPRDAFRDLWESINGPDSWRANVWVWVVSFKLTERKAVAA